MHDLTASLRFMLRHPIRAIFETELWAALVHLVRHPARSLHETFGPLLDDIARGLGQ